MDNKVESQKFQNKWSCAESINVKKFEECNSNIKSKVQTENIEECK